MEIYRSNGGRPTFHSKIFNFGGFAGLGLIGNYLLGGGCFTWKFTGKMEVDPHSTAKFSILVDLRVWGLLGTIC